MSTKYSGGFITKSPVAPTSSAASGIWTLDQQQQAQKAGTWPSPPIFIEDLFSTYLVTGDGTAPAVNNGIDVSGQGGLVWIKKRNAAGSHSLFDTARGANLRLISNDIAAQDSVNLSFTSTGFSNYTFDSTVTYASWTFKKQAKFFDIVTYTGDGVTGRTVAHGLGSVPGFIIVKPFSTSGPWAVAARKSDGDYAYGASTYAFGLNNNEPATSRSVSGLATDTTFTPAAVADVGTCNNNGVTYVAYLFAHNAGGFPASGSGSTNGISCGSYTGNGSNSGPIIDLGYEPQWLLIKKISNTSISDGSSSWVIFDIMRGFMDSDRNDPYLNPNLSAAEDSLGVANFGRPLATGFQFTSTSNLTNQSGVAYVYVAIRRGPMKTPTVGTSVYNGVLVNSSGSAQTVNATFPIDLTIKDYRNLANGAMWFDRLRGYGSANSPRLLSANTSQEGNSSDIYAGSQTTITEGGIGGGYTSVDWFFRRAPSFFDEVCYTGNGVARTITHNLGVAPELIIIKSRTNGGTTPPDWTVRAVGLGNTSTLFLNLTDAAVNYMGYVWNNANPTSTGFQLSVDNYLTNSSTGSTYVAWLFASCPGVSKVGSYTGTGAAQTIDCGFTTGSRFVLIKRADSTGDWYVWDSARGIIPANDPYLLINTTDTEFTGTDYVDTTNVGFDITSTAPAAINANGGTFIFLAIA